MEISAFARLGAFGPEKPDDRDTVAVAFVGELHVAIDLGDQVTVGGLHDAEVLVLPGHDDREVGIEDAKAGDQLGDGHLRSPHCLCDRP